MWATSLLSSKTGYEGPSMKPERNYAHHEHKDGGQ
jgi:hypothetical protein